MKILALDSSGLVASVALWEDGVMKAEYTVNYKKTHSQTLLPMLDEIVKMTETSLNGIDAIAVAAGPGSFTGLRIGSSTAKGLGQALDKPIIPVPTVDALAYNLFGVQGLICPLMDARRGQVYTGIYRCRGDVFETLLEQCALSVEELLEKLSPLNTPVYFLGDGVAVHRGTIDAKLSLPHYYAPAHLLCQRAGAVASLGAILLAQNKVVSAAEHVPEYLRQSQAERERQQRLAREGGSE